MDISPSVLYQAVRRDIERSRYGSAVEETDLDGALRNLDRNTDLGYVASLRLLSSITKKMAPPKASSEAKEAAISLFLQCNADNLKWKPPIPDTWEDAVFSEMKRIAYRELGELPDWQALLENADVGPGAVVGSRGKNSFLEKIFVNRTTTTSLSLYAEWLRFLSKKDTWLAAEICRQNSSLIFLEVVRGDTLSTVRKNTGIDRTIGSAPSLNMLFQKSLSAHIEQVLRSCYGYSPKIQPDRNRRMALKGSRDGSRATVDSTSASDLNGLRMGESLLPSCLWGAILDCRSPEVKIGNDYVKLEMISPMGNGFTFTLMTYIFSCMLKAICIVDGYTFTRFPYEEFGVFGDDIICPAPLYESVIRALLMLGHKPNVDKSYNDGAFRESCGVDCFNGKNVRGVYGRNYCTTLEDRFSLANRLNRWSARWGIPLVETMRVILPKQVRRYFVPPDEADTAGLHVPKFMSKDGIRYTARRPRKRLISIFRKNGTLKPAFNNPLGVLLAASVGRLTSGGGMVTLTRPDRRVHYPGLAVERKKPHTRYDDVRLFTPSWECEADFIAHGVRLADWRVAVYVNLELT